MEKVKVGFVGVGGIAGAHLRNVQQDPQAEIVAVCDIVKENAEKKGAEYGARAYTDIDLMLEKEMLDALFICVPPFAHGEIEEKAAKKGIHLLVEKPLGLDLDTVNRKAEAIRKAGIVNASGYCLRYLDTVQKAKEYLKDKTVAMVRGHYLTSWVPTPWYREMKKSGGQLVEQSTHTIDMIRYLVGEIDKVYANMSLVLLNDIENIDIPDVTSVNFTFESGGVGHLDSTVIQYDHRMGVELLGRDFRVVIDGVNVIIEERGKTTTYKSGIDFYAAQDRAFIEAVQTKNQDLVLASYEDGVKTLAVTLAANESQKSGQAVSLSSFCQSVLQGSSYDEKR
ncbi:Gfo/Idh/MocA family oxidoreductase [Fictibacillus sp. Mic-4]|uniref:Gfo/Idh/MocA family protein n=1 Tax=Fictibacillus sp. Mic-4 TaxID=3132826 RepID=UPI003CE957AC